MIEFFVEKSKELIELEQIINDLAQDLTHPINNFGHRYRQDSVLAFNELMAQADILRQNHASY